VTSNLMKKLSNYAVLTANGAGLRTVFPVVFHTENCAVYSGNSTVFSVYLPTPRWLHLKALDRTNKKLTNLMGKPVLCQRTFSSVFRAVFYTVKLHSLTYNVWGPLHRDPYIKIKCITDINRPIVKPT
jgi:hypothetical protein